MAYNHPDANEIIANNGDGEQQPNTLDISVASVAHKRRFFEEQAARLTANYPVPNGLARFQHCNCCFVRDIYKLIKSFQRDVPIDLNTLYFNNMRRGNITQVEINSVKRILLNHLGGQHEYIVNVLIQKVEDLKAEHNCPQIALKVNLENVLTGVDPLDSAELKLFYDILYPEGVEFETVNVAVSQLSMLANGHLWDKIKDDEDVCTYLATAFYAHLDIYIKFGVSNPKKIIGAFRYSNLLNCIRVKTSPTFPGMAISTHAMYRFLQVCPEDFFTNEACVFTQQKKMPYITPQQYRNAWITIAAVAMLSMNKEDLERLIDNSGNFCCINKLQKFVLFCKDAAAGRRNNSHAVWDKALGHPDLFSSAALCFFGTYALMFRERDPSIYLEFTNILNQRNAFLQSAIQEKICFLELSGANLCNIKGASLPLLYTSLRSAKCCGSDLTEWLLFSTDLCGVDFSAMHHNKAKINGCYHLAVSSNYRFASAPLNPLDPFNFVYFKTEAGIPAYTTPDGRVAFNRGITNSFATDELRDWFDWAILPNKLHCVYVYRTSDLCLAQGGYELLTRNYMPSLEATFMGIVYNSSYNITQFAQKIKLGDISTQWQSGVFRPIPWDQPSSPEKTHPLLQINREAILARCPSLTVNQFLKKQEEVAAQLQPQPQPQPQLRSLPPQPQPQPKNRSLPPQPQRTHTHTSSQTIPLQQQQQRVNVMAAMPTGGVTLRHVASPSQYPSQQPPCQTQMPPSAHPGGQSIHPARSSSLNRSTPPAQTPPPPPPQQHPSSVATRVNALNNAHTQQQQQGGGAGFPPPSHHTSGGRGAL
jgi:hypothetical protein